MAGDDLQQGLEVAGLVTGLISSALRAGLEAAAQKDANEQSIIEAMKSGLDRARTGVLTEAADFAANDKAADDAAHDKFDKGE